jgi:hypothetical protein
MATWEGKTLTARSLAEGSGYRPGKSLTARSLTEGTFKPFGVTLSARVSAPANSVAFPLTYLSIPVTTYYLTGWDSTALQSVYWSSTESPDFTPAVTYPALVGSLVGAAVIGSATV